MKKASKEIPIIVGPTCSGKTSLALEISKRVGGEIISADSRQIYKYMDIGTGKVPVGTDISVEKGENRWIFDGMNVWGYDLVEPGDHFSVKEYAEFALTKARSLIERGKIPVFAGGTGFYIDVVTERREISGIGPDFRLRKSLKRLPLKKLQEKLTSLNPEALESIDKNNPARLIRAIEIETADKNSGTPLPYLDDYSYKFIGLTSERSTLYERADVWLETIWSIGLMNEVTSLVRMGFRNSPQLNGIIYKSVLAFVEGELGEEEAKERSKYDLHAYIRRQQTWFKKNKSIEWLDLGDSALVDRACNLVESK